MMEREQVLQLARQNPRFQQAGRAVAQKLSQMQISPEMLDQFAHTLEYVLDNPDTYAQVLAQAIQAGFVQEGDLPPEFHKEIVIAMLLAIYEVEDQLSSAQQSPAQAEQPAFARGGLAQYGRGGDTMLAHINSREAEVLRRMGGSGTVNPNTGLREFKGGGLGDIVSAVVPMAMDYLGIGGMFGDSLAGQIGSSALSSGISSSLTGGDFMQGAATGALGAGAGSALGDAGGGWLSSIGGPTLGKGVTDALGSGVIGGGLGALTGKGFTQGAATGALGHLTGKALGSIAGSGDDALSRGIRQAGQTTGDMLSTGSTGRNALAGGALAGLARGMMPSKNADAPAGEMLSGESANDYAARAAGGGSGSSGLNWGKALAVTPTVLTLLAQAETPEQVKEQVSKGVSSLSPQQQEYFNRASQSWDWTKMQADAARQGMGLGKYMAANWNGLTAGNKYVMPAGTTSPAAAKFARGGVLTRLATGGGSGRDDTIDARLSDGEFVIDAETVALLGDGSTKEGARKLDLMRSEVRKQKGKMLSRGKISPNAKSPLAYLKGGV